MPKPLSRCTPDEAKAVYDTLRVKTLVELRRALATRGTPVSAKTLFNWRKAGWMRQRAPVSQRCSPARPVVREARAAAERVGLPADAIRALEARLTAMTDGELVVSVTRRLLIGAGMLLELVNAMALELMRSDPRGLAALYMAASRMTEGAHASMTEARNLAERAMKAKCALMLPGPHDADRDGDRSVTDRSPNANRADSDRRPFSDLIARFSGGALN